MLTAATKKEFAVLTAEWLLRLQTSWGDSGSSISNLTTEPSEHLWGSHYNSLVSGNEAITTTTLLKYDAFDKSWWPTSSQLFSYYIFACKIMVVNAYSWYGRQVWYLHKTAYKIMLLRWSDRKQKLTLWCLVQLVMHCFLSLSATRVTTLWSWQPCFCGNRSFRLLVNWLYKSVITWPSSKLANIAHDTCKAASKSLYTQACSFTPISYTGVAMVGF